MNLYVIGPAVTVGVLLGRLSCRSLPDRWVRNPRLWYSLAAFVLVLNSTIATTYIVRDNSDLRGEESCRAALAAPVNDATAENLAALARGLAVYVGEALNDPEFTALLERDPPDGLGGSGAEELREQAEAILAASAALERANDARGDDPVERCRGRS